MILQVLLAHPGTQHSHHLAHELYQRDFLGSFYTCLGVSNESIVVHWMWPLARFLRIERQWQNRILKGVPPKKLHGYPLLEMKAWWQIHNHTVARQALRDRNERFQKLISDKAIASSDLVIGFDTSSYILANRAKAQGKKFIIDRSIGHPRYYAAVIEKLAERFPD